MGLPNVQLFRRHPEVMASRAVHHHVLSGGRPCSAAGSVR